VSQHLVSIAFQGGTHGNFLRYFIDRHSKLTPDIKELPFTENGTSHNDIKYSNLIDRYHPLKYPPYFKNKTVPHIFISIDEDDILFLQRIVNTRAGDLKIDLNNETIKLSSSYILNYDIEEKFKNLYDKSINENTEIPRFIFRDFLKLAFLDKKKDGFIQKNKKYISNLPDNTFLFPVKSFWDKELFFKNIKQVSEKFNLGIDLNAEAESIYGLFIKNIKQYHTRYRCENIIEILKNNKNINLDDIDTVEQAYLSAWIESNYKFVTIPLTNNFFKNTKEILDWIEWYPQFYKAMNPNLPTFNGIPNPYHLHNLKK
jgi:hypothetical protein